MGRRDRFGGGAPHKIVRTTAIEECAGSPNRAVCLAVTLPSLAYSFRAQEILGEYLELRPDCPDVNPQAQEGWGRPKSQEVFGGRAGSKTPGCPDSCSHVP